MKKIFLIAVSSLLLFSSCREIFAKRVRGNGNITTQTRPAGEFTGVDVSGNIDVIVRQDPVHAVKVETDENLQEYVEIFDEGETLRIERKEGFNLRSSKPIRVYVSAPDFKKFDASGACSISSENEITSANGIRIGLSGASSVNLFLNSPAVDADGSGASSIKIKGQTKDFKVEGSGASDVKCSDLLAENVTVRMSGAGDAEVNASKTLNGSLSGASSVHYKGAAVADISTSGASSVKKIN